MKLYKVLFVIVIVFCSFFLYGQKRDVNYFNHWNNKPNCCVYIFENTFFVGMLLDGSKLLSVQPYLITTLSRISKLSIDSLSFNLEIDTNLIWQFEKLLLDTLIKDKSINLHYVPYLNLDYYFRQYVRFQVEDEQYLIVSFNVEKNLKKKNDKFYYYGNKNKEKVELNDDTKLVYCRGFFRDHNRFNIPSGSQFFILYNNCKESIEFIYVIDESNL